MIAINAGMPKPKDRPSIKPKFSARIGTVKIKIKGLSIKQFPYILECGMMF
jgi:hypothetical protein